MGASTGIVLAATGISMGNEWIQTNDINLRIGMAGLASALILDGIEKLSPQAATGLASIMLVSVLLTPLNGKSPIEALSDGLNGVSPKAPSVAGAKPGRRTLTTAPGRRGYLGKAGTQ